MFNNILAKNNKVNNIRQQEFGLSINKGQIYYLEKKILNYQLYNLI